MTITPAQLEAVKKFLTILASPMKEQGDNTLLYSLSSSASGMAINGRALRDVNALYNEYVRPTLKPAANAAPVTGVTPGVGLAPPPPR